MQALSQAIGDVMIADATLAGLLGTYKTLPAVFTRRPVPVDAPYPMALAATVAGDVAADYVGAGRGRLITQDINVIGAATGDGFAKVDAAAERVLALFHRNRFAVTGYDTLTVIASGPIDSPADPQEIARTVTLQVRLKVTGT